MEDMRGSVMIPSPQTQDVIRRKLQTKTSKQGFGHTGRREQAVHQPARGSINAGDTDHLQ